MLYERPVQFSLRFNVRKYDEVGMAPNVAHHHHLLGTVISYIFFDGGGRGGGREKRVVEMMEKYKY